MMNKLILGNVCDVLKTLPSNTIDLVYYDASYLAFNIKNNYNVVINELKEQITEIKRVMKNTGIMYVYLKSTDTEIDYSHYIKTNIDKIFGVNNFRNELVINYPKKENMRNYSKKIRQKYIEKESKNYLMLYDRIYLYSKSEDYYVGNKSLRGNVFNIDKKLWRDKAFFKCLKEIIKLSINNQSFVLFPYMINKEIIDIANELEVKWLGINSLEKIEDVIEEGVYDSTENKLAEKFWNFDKGYYLIKRHTYFEDYVKNMNPFEFESWIIKIFGGKPNIKRQHDKGIDGVDYENRPIQVKKQKRIGRNVVDNFLSAVRRYNKELFETNVKNILPVGYIIAFGFGTGAKNEVERLRKNDNIHIKLVDVEEIVKIDSFDVETEIKMIESKNKKTGLEFTVHINNIKTKIDKYYFDLDYKGGNKIVPDYSSDNGIIRIELEPWMYNMGIAIKCKQNVFVIDRFTIVINGEKDV